MNSITYGMNKILLGLVFALAISCEYNTVSPSTCYLASVETGYLTTFKYNDKNELISYATPSIYSSTLNYDGSGKIISELDNGSILITYKYDNNHRLVLWSEYHTTNPASNFAVSFYYNSAGQDTLKQSYAYDVFNGYYLIGFTRLSYSSTMNMNYSERKVYNANSVLEYTENFLWDTHPNPYLTNAFFINEPPPSNNVKQYTFTPVGGEASVTDITYTYNSSGFPLTQAIAEYGTTASYSYTNCH